MKSRHRASDISFRQQNRRTYRARAFLVFGIVVLISAITIASVGIKQTKSFVLNFSGSILGVRAAAGDTIATTADLATTSKKSLIVDRDNLQQQVEDLKAQVLTLSALKIENEKLQEMFGRKVGTHPHVLGRIIAKPNQSVYDTLVVDVGENEGITIGSKVFARGDIVVGTVLETSTQTSKIQLFSTSAQKTKAVLNGHDIFIDLVGRGGGTFEATLPRDVKVEAGSAVSLPEGDIVALAEESIVDPRDPFQKILFRSPVNLFELRYISIEK